MPMPQRAPLNPLAKPNPQRLPVPDPALLEDPEGAVRALMATGMLRWDALVALAEADSASAFRLTMAGLPPALLRLRQAEALLRALDRRAAAGPSAANGVLNLFLEGRQLFRTLSLERRGWVTSLPERLRTSTLHLRETGIVALPDKLVVDGSLFLQGCFAWDGRIPPGVEVRGHVHTDTYPNGIRLKGWRLDHPRGERWVPSWPMAQEERDATVAALVAAGQSRWEALVGLVEGGADPEAIWAQWGVPPQALVAFENTWAAIEAFNRIAQGDPKGANVALLAFLEGRTVPGDLILSDSPWIERLPPALRVAGHLVLGQFALPDLEQRVELPEGLWVGGGLFLEGTPLRHLPQGLHVEGDLGLRACPAWDGWIPEDAWVGGTISSPRHGLGPDLAAWRRLHPHGEKR
jgi:hypothetical protein